MLGVSKLSKRGQACVLEITLFIMETSSGENVFLSNYSYSHKPHIYSTVVLMLKHSGLSEKKYNHRCDIAM